MRLFKFKNFEFNRGLRPSYRSPPRAWLVLFAGGAQAANTSFPHSVVGLATMRVNVKHPVEAASCRLASGWKPHLQHSFIFRSGWQAMQVSSIRCAVVCRQPFEPIHFLP